ncbi:MAG: hypothetical protein EI684_03150 [Candidatus Viridilinea halotolerans]|uniref:FHA domain-containing protein n=1 Tax=Candidatus Viridilinea halotolerans TaxID=2491704 RepID=A0A426U8B0_9CHLR|nr:MAG: hypothetical protein EI684_03150 [Candidatus Viridilinea halotolerans]
MPTLSSRLWLVLTSAWLGLLWFGVPSSVGAMQPPETTPTAVVQLGSGATPTTADAPPSFTFWPFLLVAAMTLSAGTSWVVARRQGGPPPPDAEASLLPASPVEITTAKRQVPVATHTPLRAIIWDGQRRHRIALHGRQWSIGAAPGCNLCFPEAGLAPLHARLSLVGDQIEVTALEPGVFHTGLGSPLSLDLATPLGEGEALLFGASLRLTVEVT